jgi:hypothetical protein
MSSRSFMSSFRIRSCFTVAQHLSNADGSSEPEPHFNVNTTLHVLLNSGLAAGAPACSVAVGQEAD